MKKKNSVQNYMDLCHQDISNLTECLHGSLKKGQVRDFNCSRTVGEYFGFDYSEG